MSFSAGVQSYNRPGRVGATVRVAAAAAGLPCRVTCDSTQQAQTAEHGKTAPAAPQQILHRSRRIPRRAALFDVALLRNAGIERKYTIVAVGYHSTALTPRATAHAT